MPLGLNHHRNARDNINEVRAGAVTITNTEKQLSVEAEDFPRRKQLAVVNDSSGLFFISDETPFTIGIGSKFTIFGGEALILNIDPDRPVTWFAKTDDPGISLSIRVVEIR